VTPAGADPPAPRPGPPAGSGADDPAGLAHLRGADPVLARLIDAVGEPRPARRTPAGDPYAALIWTIVGQQLSARSARAINARLLDRFGGRAPTPREVLDDDPDALRVAAGLSRAKTAYLRSLAEHVLDGSLQLERLPELPDEEIVAELVAIKGLGPWTAQIFLIFHLQRADVLPTGDVGIRRAVQRAYDLPGPPGPEQLTRIAAPWRPHRTLACRFLWRSLDNAPG